MFGFELELELELCVTCLRVSTFPVGSVVCDCRANGLLFLDPVGKTTPACFDSSGEEVGDFAVPFAVTCDLGRLIRRGWADHGRRGCRVSELV